MLRKLLTAFSVVLLSASFAFAQNGSVTGVVTDANSGETLPGVNVVLTELQRGTSSNADGEYTIENVPSGTYTLEATFIGYKNVQTQVEVSSGEVQENIAIQPDVLGLDEVTVSALGFEQNSDEVGTSSSRVGGEDIAASGETNVVAGLSAKAAGVNISTSSGDPGAASRIVIRGANTITGDNSPLFVVDGVPVYNSSFGSGVGGVVQQSRINDFNPEDIKSVQVLKGPSAAALWGSRAANGVVLIETKTGKSSQDGKINITLKSELSVDELNKTIDLQRQYGQGSGGEYSSASSSSWGDKIADRTGENVVDMSNGNAYFGPNGNRFGLITDKNSQQTYDHAREIFETGFKMDNSLALSGGDESGTFYLSVGNLTQNGIILNNSDFDRTTVKGSATRYFDNITATVNAQYTNTSSNRIQQGSNISGLILGAYRTAPDFNNRPFTVDYISEDGNIIPDGQRSYRNPVGAPGSPGYNNVLWTIENVRNNSRVRRLQGSTELSYDPLPWLNFTHRLGVDTYSDRRFEVFPVNDASNPTGALTEEEISQYQVNSDLIAKATHTFNEGFSGSFLVGWNLNNRETDQVGANSTDIILESFNRDVSNYNSKNPFQFRSTVRTSALYSVLNLNAYEMLFLELTGRQESASTFGPDTDASFFYPSGNLAWQFTKLDAFQDNGILSFGKLRVSYGEAGVQPPVYSTTTTFFQDTFTSSWGDGLTPAEYGGGFARSGEAGNSSLKVERTSEFEFGADLRFFDDRFVLNLTRYLTETEDAILPVDRAPSSGFGSQQLNAATLENKGFEAELDFELIRSRNFSWVARGTWSKNINKVTSLAGANEVGLAGFTSMTSSAIVGEQYGVFFGNQLRRASEFPISDTERDVNGFTVGDDDIVLDGNGFPVAADAQGILGDPNPDWRAGIGSTFEINNFTADFLFDIKHGGDVWNGTKGALYFFGVHGDQVWETTAEQDLTDYTGATIPAGTIFRGYVEDYGAGPVAVTEPCFTTGICSAFTGAEEPFIEDGGFVRLRQVSLGYSFSGKQFSDLTGLRSIDLNVTGRNLFLLTDYTGIDPETNLTGPSNGFGLDYFNNPNTRSFIFSVRVNY